MYKFAIFGPMKYLFLCCALLWGAVSSAQHAYGPFTHADTLRGALRPERSCFDVTHYDLTIDQIDFKKKCIHGTNIVTARITEPTQRIQLDLFAGMKLLKVSQGKKKLQVQRDGNAFFITLPRMYQPGEMLQLTVEYEGAPQVAKNAPWDGGFVWTSDPFGYPWLGVACQGTGASLWWPNKDHLSDEPDSMHLHYVMLNDSLWSVGNGTYLGNSERNGKTFSDYRISYPINNYNVSLYVGHYTYLSDVYINGTDTLDLAYLVIKGHEEKARAQFAMVPEMLACFEKYFGPYPFFKDGYGLVETPYAGMEHQSAIAYGNRYMKGYLGRDYSGIGLMFDFIIVHETGHEYWGNNVSMQDINDMWIHEGFCTYAEVLYADCVYGEEKALQYINHKKQMVQNDRPLISPPGVNAEPTGDIYPKGALLLHTIRGVLQNDVLFLDILKSMQDTFALKNITTADVIAYFNTRSGTDLTPVFNAYLHYINIPVFEYSLQEQNGRWTLKYRWKCEEPGFRMPLGVWINGVYKMLQPSAEWQMTELSIAAGTGFVIDTDHFYIQTKKIRP